MLQHASATIQGISCLAKQRVHWCFQGAAAGRSWLSVVFFRWKTRRSERASFDMKWLSWRMFSTNPKIYIIWSNHLISMTDNDSPWQSICSPCTTCRQWTVGTFGQPLGVIWPMRTCRCLGLSSLICGVYSLVLVFCGLWLRVIFSVIMTYFI